MEILVIGAVIGLIPAAIAKNKGYSFILWWFFGTLLFIVALPAALLMKPDAAALERSQLSGGMKKCPFCAELIKLEANVCKHCGRELILAQAQYQTQYQTAANETAHNDARRFTGETAVAIRNIATVLAMRTAEPQALLDKPGMILAMAFLALVGALAGYSLISVHDQGGDSANTIFRRTADVLQGSVTSDATPTRLTLANFGMVQTGMSRYEVGDILGFGWNTIAENEFGQGTDFHVTTEALEWQDGRRIVTCMFQNGKLIQKAQAGLE